MGTNPASLTDTLHIVALKRLGYVERETAFFSLVAHHSGYFVRRQYQQFGGYRGGFEKRLLRRAESV